MKKLVILLFICLFLAGCVTTGDAWYHAYGHTAYYWPAVERVEKSPEYLYIMLSVTSAMIVPARHFSTPEDFDYFYQVALKYHQDALGTPVTADLA